MTKLVQFPRQRDILETEIDRYLRRRGGSQAALADELRISAAWLSAWKLGHKAVPAERIPSLVKVLRGEGRGSERLATDLGKATGTAITAERTVSALDMFQMGEPVRLGSLPFSPFSGRTHDFFEDLFQLFRISAGLRTLESGTVRLAETHKMLIEDQSIQGIRGLLWTPDRTRQYKFYYAPPRLSINAVMIETTTREDMIPKARSVVLDRSRAEDEGVLLINNPWEIGGLHYAHTDEAHRFDIADFSIAGLASSLLETASQSSLFPVVVADEFTCLQLLTELRIVTNPRLVLPLRWTGETETELRTAYPMGFSVDRRDRRWADYLDDTWPAFLDSNCELIVERYNRLHQQLAILVAKHLQSDAEYCACDASTRSRIAQTWATGVLRLRRTPDDAASWPDQSTKAWATILRGTLDKVNEQMNLQRHTGEGL